ncbi:MAG: TetR/AcrR family transcriptional regulator [Candidatus Binatia bacterium]
MAAPFSSPASFRINTPPPPPAAGPNGNVPRRRGRASKISRQQILDAALIEFAEKGYGGATTAAIARRLGVTQPLIHYHFGSKEALWHEAVHFLFTQFWTDMESAFANVRVNGSPETVRDLIRTFVHAMAGHVNVVRIIANEGYRESPRLAWLVEEYLRPMFDAALAFLDDARSGGILSNQSREHLLFAFLGAATSVFYIGPTSRELYGLEANSPENIERQVELMYRLFVS